MGGDLVIERQDHTVVEETTEYQAQFSYRGDMERSGGAEDDFFYRGRSLGPRPPCTTIRT